MATAVDTPTTTKTRGKILIVDDELVVRDSLGKWFTSEGYTARPTGSAREALEAIQQMEFDIALIDIKMPGMDGMELQSRLHEADPELTVIIMPGYASVETAVQALKHGAYDYITKPVDPDELSHLVAKALEHKRARREVVRLRENLQEVFPSTELIGKSAVMKKVTELIEMVAPTEATVLITGESGTGKEVVARAIHAAGPRRYMPMVTIHCGALTEPLLESERVNERLERRAGRARRARHIERAAARRVEMRERRQERGRFHYHVAVPVEGRRGRPGAIAQLGHHNGVRLLPDDQGSDGRGAVASVGGGHFRPARALVTLFAGAAPGGRKNRAVPFQAPLHQRRASPFGEMRGVPEVHLQVELAVPAIAGKPGFLRRQRAGALDGGQIFGKHRPALQLACARIGGGGEIERRAARPEPRPVIARGLVRLPGGG